MFIGPQKNLDFLEEVHLMGATYHTYYDLKLTVNNPQLIRGVLDRVTAEWESIFRELHKKISISPNIKKSLYNKLQSLALANIRQSVTSPSSTSKPIWVFPNGNWIKSAADYWSN